MDTLLKVTFFYDASRCSESNYSVWNYGRPISVHHSHDLYETFSLIVTSCPFMTSLLLCLFMTSLPRQRAFFSVHILFTISGKTSNSIMLYKYILQEMQKFKIYRISTQNSVCRQQSASWVNRDFVNKSMNSKNENLKGFSSFRKQNLRVLHRFRAIGEQSQQLLKGQRHQEC